ncbi:hypothetical protein [Streptomyces sp. NPDC006879]|uniref:hypothetical protein n=1 Tax=Streptomyces sp. NPDC006879 TaxID=3364767 RepID=UPI00369FC0E2
MKPPAELSSPITPFDEEFATDPAAVFARLRSAAPVHHVALPDGSRALLVTREADVRAWLADARLSVDKKHAHTGYRGFCLPPALDANLLNMDGPTTCGSVAWSPRGSPGLDPL